LQQASLAGTSNANELLMCAVHKLTMVCCKFACLTRSFPRCEHIRYDKPWHECMDMRDIRDLLDGVRAAPAPGAAPGRERRKKAARKIQRDRGGGVAEQFKVFQSSDAVQEGNIFEGIEFCVMPSSRYRKQNIEEMIVRNGGNCVGAPAVKDGLGTVIIAGNETFQVKNHIASGRYDVLDVSFILESVERGEQVAMAPHYFIYMTDATARELRKTTDVFGDHLWEDTDAQTLKRVFDEVRQKGKKWKQLHLF
jgi:DNA ligase-4